MRIVLHAPVIEKVVDLARDHLPAGFSLDVTSAADSPARLATTLEGAEFLVGFVGPLPDQAWQAAKSLRLIQLLSAGYDTFQVDRARALGVPVATIGGANAIPVAEHAVLLMLATLRHLPRLDRSVRDGIWRASNTGEDPCYELTGRKVGLIGFGMIGRCVAKCLRGFAVDLRYYDVRRLPPAEESALGATYQALERLLAEAEIISLHLPLLPETRGLIDSRAIALMRPDAILINTARGQLVDEVALANALREKRLRGAGIDAFTDEPPRPDNPLLALTDNVVLTPHTAGPTWESWPRRFVNAFANVERVARGEAPLWVIPELR